MNYLVHFCALTRKPILFNLLAFAFIYASTLIIYAAPGDLDRSFGTNGIINTSFTYGSTIYDSFLQPDGKFVIVGETYGGSATNVDFYVLRFNSDGSPDTTFDGDGKATIAVSPREDQAFGVVTQPDGKILVLGRTRDANANYDFAVVRLNVNGTPDNTFGNNGVVITSTSPRDDNAYDAVIQPDNKIVVCGTATGNSGFVISTLVRYNPNGTLDTTFDEDGIAINESSKLTVAVAIAMQPDGKFVLAGALAGGITFYFAAARYNTNGSIDTSFGNGGSTIVDVRIGIPPQNSAKALAIQPDGKIVLAGNSNSGLDTSFDFAATRLNSNGTLDESFGNSGKVVTPLPGNFDDGANDVVLQPDGKIVVGGIGKGVSPDPNFTLIRYNQNGTLDTRFGNKGIAAALVTGSTESVAKMRIEPDGKIFVAGFTSFDITFVRYQVNGSREADFDGDKKSDISVFRPSNGVWYLQQSQAGFAGFGFGASDDLITPADFDGDGKTDIAVFRPSNGVWYLQQSTAGFNGILFGATGDIPMPADFDGDGKADLAVFRPSNGVWYVQGTQAGFYGTVFGANGDKPVAADYDGDGKADIAVFRPSNGVWYIQRSQLGFTGVSFGDSADKAVPADYDGDGKTDIAVFRPSNGVWYLQQSTAGFVGIAFGAGDDLPVPADYDGDGKTDVSVFRPSNGVWYLNRSTQGFTGISFGANGDKPAPNAFIQ